MSVVVYLRGGWTMKLARAWVITSTIFWRFTYLSMPHLQFWLHFCPYKRPRWYHHNCCVCYGNHFNACLHNQPPTSLMVTPGWQWRDFWWRNCDVWWRHQHFWSEINDRAFAKSILKCIFTKMQSSAFWYECYWSLFWYSRSSCWWCGIGLVTCLARSRLQPL